MKKIIEGKSYNTETAELLHSWNNGCYSSDFKSCSESLFKTKKGNYFLAGEGGAMSKYAKRCGSKTVYGFIEGEGIEPVSEKAAVEWLESHDGDDAIEKHFPSYIEEA